MKTLRISAALVLATGLAAGVSLTAAQGNVDGKKYDKGATVTLQGCVIAGEKKDTFVLNNVKEWPIGKSEMGKHGQRMYWIDKDSKAIMAHLGHTIQVTGKITDVQKSEMELKRGELDGGLVVEIEGPGKDVVTPAANAGVSIASRPNTNDIPITLLKLKIDDIKMTSSTCSSTL
jgi:hypothetical protein